MAREFAYRAINIEGKHVSGTVSAGSEDEARAQLFSMGLAATDLKEAAGEKPGGAGSEGGGGKGLTLRISLPSFSRGVPIADLILFTKQFRTLYVAGIPLSEIFTILEEQSQNSTVKKVAGAIEKRIREGESLRSAFAEHPKVFEHLYVAMIDAGERSGALPKVLERLVYILEHEEKIKNQIQSALRYPKMLIGVMIGAFLILLNYVVPQFASVYSAAKVELPLPTVIAIQMNKFLSDYWWMALGLTVVIVGAVKYWLSTKKGIVARDRWVLKIPVVGPLIQKAIIARFASIFSILQQSGVTIIESMDVLRETVDNQYFCEQFETVKEKLRGGAGIAESIGSVQGFSPLAINLLSVGEKSSHLEEMMDELAKHYDEEVELQVDKLTEYLGPALILCLGVVVLFFALAIFLPMWDMVKFVK